MHRQSYRLKAGNLRNLNLVEETLPEPAANEVCIEVKAIGLNFADIFAMWGLYSATPKGEFIPGLEYAGVVVKTGKEAATVKVGDRIMGVTRFGAYTSHLNIDQRYVLPLPEDWSFEEGASYLVQALTAYYGLKELGNIQPGQTVLIHSAAGGVGIYAGRIARKLGAYTIGTVGSHSKLDFLQQEGYHRSIVRNARTFREDLPEALDGRELHIIMECIGGKIFSIGYELLAPQGRHIVYGSARYGSVGDRPDYLRMLWLYLTRPRLDPQKMPEQNKAIMGFNLIWLYHKVDLMHQLLGELDAMQLPRPHVGHTFEFGKLKEAIHLFQGGKTVGKVVLSR
jgi:NADPH:quinone reductase-like Zn-dependent oxidoreductase